MFCAAKLQKSLEFRVESLENFVYLQQNYEKIKRI